MRFPGHACVTRVQGMEGGWMGFRKVVSNPGASRDVQGPLPLGFRRPLTREAAWTARESMSRRRQGKRPSPPLPAWVGYLAAQCLSFLILETGTEILGFTVLRSCKQNTKSQAKGTGGLLC